MSKFSNFKIKWPKSVEKVENGSRLGPLGQNKTGSLDPPVHKLKLVETSQELLKWNVREQRSGGGGNWFVRYSPQLNAY